MNVIAVSTTSSIMPESNRLPELAARANDEHGKAAVSARRTVEHAIAAGEALAEAKANIGHGGWLKWLKAECPEISNWTASRYMRAWHGRDQFGHTVPNLSLRAALKAIAKKLPEPDADDEAAAESGKRSECFTIEEWREAFHHPDLILTLRSEPSFFGGEKARLLKQTGSGIEWAQWSWNPITGCLHECPYCYARDIAERYENAFPHGFTPVFWPGRLAGPGQTKVPRQAEIDTRYRNVFTCSMADLFGRWVPAEWIELVLHQVRENPQWNFLFLTKFPKRMAEFEIPDNAWMGTTVDLQARVKAAEAAFAKIKSGIRWLSVEPMLEPLKFNRLDLFDWIVIGGASPSKQTPAWKPPIDWIIDLRAQARAAGLAIYDKTNLYGSRTTELPFNAPIKGDPTEAPDVFHYLGKGGP